MDDEEMEEVQLSEGMPVENMGGEKLGTLSALLIEEDEEAAEFILLGTPAGDRLVPYEAALGAEEGSLVLDVPAANVARFPLIAANADPTEDQMQAAYDIFDEGKSDEGDDDEDDD